MYKLIRLPLLFIVLLTASTCLAATIHVTGAANWSTCNGGGAPGATDDIQIEGAFALSLDGGNGATYTCSTIKAVAADGVTPTAGTLNPGTSTPYTLNANLYAGTVTLLTNPSGKTITAATSSKGGTAGTAHGITNNGIITLLSTATGGTAGHGCYNPGTITTLTTANAGAGGHGVYNAGSITNLLVVNGGGTTNAHGCNNYTGGTVSAIGISTGGLISGSYGYNGVGGTGYIAIAKGGTATGAYGVNHTTGSTYVNAVDLTGTAAPVFVRGIYLKPGLMVNVLNYTLNADLTLCDAATVAAAGNVASGVARYTGGTNGTRVDCPVAKALTTSGNYGDPASPLVGAYVGPADSDVWYGVANGVSPGAGTKRASSILNCTPANVKAGTAIDNVTGTYSGAGHE